MFERFTKRVKTVLDLARKEAIKSGHNRIETEHLLLGLIDEGEGMGVAILRHLGMDPESLRLEIEKSMRVGVPLMMMGEIPLSSDTKKVLELAVKEAQYLGHTYVGTEHLLIGLAAQEEGLAARILTRHGLTVEKMRQSLENLLYEVSEDTPTQYRPAKAKTKTPALDTFGRDLTRLAQEGKLDPVIGRHQEIERVTQILCRRKKNNPVLLGEPGVGKTAIVEGFAQSIASGQAPELLRKKRVVMLDLASLVAGTKYRGEFEQRVKTVLDEIKTSANVIIFIDELHTLVGAGGAEGAIDASNILKPALSRGEIQCIGATTLDEYRKYIEKDGALERRFQPVMINPPTVEQTVAILKGLREKYEEHHRLKITDQAIEAAASLSDRYISGRYLPDKAIDLIDEAASQRRLKLSQPPSDLKKLEKEVAEITKKKDEAINRQDFEKAAALRDQERELKNRLDYLRANWEKLIPEEEKVVTESDIAQVVSRWTGIPVAQLCKEEKEKLLKMEESLSEVVVGQKEAISAVSRAIKRSRAGLKDRKRPIGSFLFLGPTGVGKTLLARALAEFLFGEEQALIQIDMSEYMEKFAVSRLIGAPPGYVGYEEGGQLTERVRRRPYCVVLLDEIEKAHPEVFNLLLQVLEEGRLTDSFGRSVSFQNSLLIMTSNIGTESLKNQATIGFRSAEAEASYEVMKQRILTEIRRVFRPEFINRLDEIIVFHPLSEQDLLAIVDLEIAKVAERLKEQKLSLRVSKAAKIFLMKHGTNAQFGARPLRRTIARYLEDPLSEEILTENFPAGMTIQVECKGERLTFQPGKGETCEENPESTTCTSS
ncbi:MAG: ATP-dependent Clp protease ATP-binding subunit [Candidatus Omnitrophica bacterium]|nr:ATP-dependent Clp protease ATP-binding subunit [Candidatus Omnitrophota bacterium]